MDTSEKGLEKIIVDHLRDKNGYTEGTTMLYDRDLALVPSSVERFLRATQSGKVQNTMIYNVPSETNKFYQRLKDEITKRGVIDVLRKGFKYNGEILSLYFPLPDAENPSAKVAYAENEFMVIRQLKYSKLNENAIDFIICINGLPLMTFELKNSLTGQHTDNAIRQYKTDRDPKELLLQPKRCAVHMAVDDTEVWMCTSLAGKDSWFLPFNKGVNGGAGNPVNPNGLMTAYLWEEVLRKETLSNIIENFAQVIREEDKKTHKVKERCIWPRYHQLVCVEALLRDTQAHDVGQKYLIQHSAGSGKSNSITWLAYQLVNLKKADYTAKFDSVIVVTDRVNLDKQIRDNITAYSKLQNIVGWADSSDTLRQMLQGGKKIVITVINKFSYILDALGSSLKDKNFAIIIDEAHSSQNGSLSAKMGASVAGLGTPIVRMYPAEDDEPLLKVAEDYVEQPEEEDFEDRLARIIEGRKMAKNANYYAFTATPKNKTLEMFGVPFLTADGQTGHRPFHEYTMKQAIEEGFILDVLRHYTTYNSYYKILKAVEDDPQFDAKRAQSKLRAFVEGQPETIERKAEIIVEHFCTRVHQKVGGKARAMVVTSTIERAIEFYRVITRLLCDRKSQFKAIVAFTDKEIDGHKYTESELNGFPSSEIEKRMEEEPYRLLIVADKFQTGYDQPLLHTMYVDKQLSDLKAVQTLSRLNRCHPKKNDTFVLDFCNDADAIEEAFQRYYKTTILSGETDPNKLNDLWQVIEEKPFYTDEDVDKVVQLAVMGTDEDRPKVDALLDSVVERFKDELEEDEQIKAKSAMKSFVRLYHFVSAVTPYKSTAWEKMFEFYVLLVRKLPVLRGEDFTKGLLDNIDFDKYELEKNAEVSIQLEDKDTEVGPIPVGNPGGASVPELEELSKIVDQFNEMYGNIAWKNPAEVTRQILELPERMARSLNFVNAMRNSDEQTAEVQFNADMMTIVASMLEEKTEFVQQYFTNLEFQQFINKKVYAATKKTLQTTVILGDQVNSGGMKIVRPQ